MQGGSVYQFLLRDPRWLGLKKFVIKRSGGRCSKCHRRAPQLDVHHKQYLESPSGRLRKPWEYKPKDLMTLCHSCHVSVHQKQPHTHTGGGIMVGCGGSIVSKLWHKVKSHVATHFKVRKDLPPKVRAFLYNKGDVPITSISVAREPINSAIKQALNLISLGRFKKAMADKGYDSMFHLYLWFKLQDGTQVLLERNEVIEIRYPDPSKPIGDFIPVQFNAQTTLNQMWKNALQLVGDGIYIYDPINNNCQRFVYDFLRANSLMNPTVQQYVMQDAEHLLPDYAHKFGRFTTDFAAKMNHVLNGSGRLRFGGYIHRSPQTRAAQDAALAAEKQTLASALAPHVEDLKNLVGSLMSGDQEQATKTVMDLVHKVAPMPGYQAVVPFLTGFADLVSGHTRPDDPMYETKIRSYIDDAFSTIPYIGPIIEKALLPDVKPVFHPPSESYTGQIFANPANARKFDGNLQMRNWKQTGLEDNYWNIKTPEEMEAYNQRNGTNYNVYYA